MIINQLIYLISSIQIDKIGKEWLKSEWLGVFPLDKIPYIPVSRALVVNTQTSNLEGEHWLAVYHKPEHILVFDPFGFYYPSLLVSQISSLSKPIIYNRTQYQKLLSTNCGPLCLLWLRKQYGGWRNIQQK